MREITFTHSLSQGPGIGGGGGGGGGGFEWLWAIVSGLLGLLLGLVSLVKRILGCGDETKPQSDKQQRYINQHHTLVSSQSCPNRHQQLSMLFRHIFFQLSINAYSSSLLLIITKS